MWGVGILMGGCAEIEEQRKEKETDIYSIGGMGTLNPNLEFTPADFPDEHPETKSICFPEISPHLLKFMYMLSFLLNSKNVQLQIC